MTDRRLAVAAWESLFRAQHEVLHEISGDFSDDDLTQAEYDVLLTVTRGDDHAARLRAALDGLTPDELAAAIKAIRCLSEL